MKLSQVIIVALLGAAIVPALPARAAEANGFNLSRRWCGGCHAVSSDGYSVGRAWPFFFMANNADFTSERLHLGLTPPHPVLLNFEATSENVAAIVGYIESLRVR